ncbi:MAG: GNAT family N-acetyltransferase [Frateuria sp.]|uniref:GNAT family N-acetyltransferase n=1 Tax=Frateuria sp. TaxID=2211372 RepID=UPI0017DE9AA2|nr:GNAT family N-acetyltransferase [Frateuria sp.]NUO72582.1 GNAT family N-acetyltransferase [Frateuria sp.]NUR23978.1 GNAT family N-acetyltransferase [Frateuria sp.]
MSLLDRPVWSSLSTAHADLSLGDDLARRYKPDVNRFASARDDGETAQRALARLVQPSEHVFILQAQDIRIPSGLVAIKEAQGVQMVAHAPVAPPGEGADGIVALSDRDAAEMLALATLTEPGPFLRHTHRMGRFFGVRVDGRLAAMAGERFHFPGHTEVSGVCTHPDFRGHGLAKRLSRHVAAGIAARGETAFLHAWKSNDAAIALYHALGFRWRCDVNIAVLGRDPE